MGKVRGDVERKARVFLVLELEHVWRGEDAGIWVVDSRAGREDAVSKPWRSKNGLLNASQLEDLVAYVDDLVRGEIIRFCGVQEMLEQ